MASSKKRELEKRLREAGYPLKMSAIDFRFMQLLLTQRIREQRTQFAREQAMKAPVKMVFPMILFIFPSIFIVLMGPLIIYLIQNVL